MYAIYSNNFDSKYYATAEEAARDAREMARRDAHYLRNQNFQSRKSFFRQEMMDIAYDVCDADHPEDALDSFYPIEMQISRNSMKASEGHLYATGKDQFGYLYTVHAVSKSECDYEDGDSYSKHDWSLESVADRFGDDVTDLVVTVNGEVI